MDQAWALWVECPDPCRCQVVLVEQLEQMLEPELLAPLVPAVQEVQAACQAVWAAWEEWEVWAE